MSFVFLVLLLLSGCGKDSAAPAASAQPPAPVQVPQDPCLAHFVGNWTRDQGVMHRQVDLFFRYDAASASISLTFVPFGGTGAPTVETFVVDGQEHVSNAIGPYSATCAKFALEVYPEPRGDRGARRRTLFLDMLGLSVQEFSATGDTTLYQRYARTDLAK